MYKHRSLVVVVAILLILTPLVARGAAERDDALTVYAYDTFTGDWGPGPALAKAFEEHSGIRVNLVGSGDAVAMMSRLITEKDATVADVVVGITDDMSQRLLDADLLVPYESRYLAEIPAFLDFDPSHRLLPFTYGTYAFVVDTQRLEQSLWPTSLSDLADPRYKDKIILIDPRTSSVGLGLLLWGIAEFGEDGYLGWWEAVKKNALTITDGWSSAYGLFTEGEAPLVISFTTSPLYHVLNENTTRYQALIFDSGHQTTIEGVGILASSTKQTEARAFVDYLLEEAQLDVAIANSMYPTNASIVLPEVFAWAPKPAINLTVASEQVTEHLDRWLTEWTEVMSR